MSAFTLPSDPSVTCCVYAFLKEYKFNVKHASAKLIEAQNEMQYYAFREAETTTPSAASSYWSGTMLPQTITTPSILYPGLSCLPPYYHPYAAFPTAPSGSASSSTNSHPTLSASPSKSSHFCSPYLASSAAAAASSTGRPLCTADVAGHASFTCLPIGGLGSHSSSSSGGSREDTERDERVAALGSVSSGHAGHSSAMPLFPLGYHPHLSKKRGDPPVTAEYLSHMSLYHCPPFKGGLIGGLNGIGHSLVDPPTARDRLFVSS